MTIDDAFFREQLAELETLGRRRSLRYAAGPPGPVAEIDGRSVLVFCGNNYLGLAGAGPLAGALAQGAERYGAGSTGSRLISGSFDVHRLLEEEAAEFSQAQAALLFNSGFHANVGTISALVGRGDAIFSDELNHASIIDGARLSRAKVYVYPHNNLRALTHMLESCTEPGNRLIVSDTLFSMDGDTANLPALCDLADSYGAATYFDEAHAVGVFGQGGGGVTEEQGVTERATLRMSTLGKALGTYGAWVAGSENAVDYLRNRARSFVFSTALPPAVAQAGRTALKMVRSETALRETLWDNRRHLAAGLRDLGFDTGSSVSQIIPVILGPDDLTMRFCEKLLERGVYVQGIRPPTVPEGTSRLRVTVMANHTREHLERVLDAFAEVRSELAVG